MRLYDCKVLLAGNRNNEVRKSDITAAEIMVLQEIHGGIGSIIEIQPKGMDKRSHADERAHLFNTYVGTTDTPDLSGQQKARADMLRNLFGPSHMPLPVELPKGDSFVGDELAAPVVRAKVVPKAGKAEDVAHAALT